MTTKAAPEMRSAVRFPLKLNASIQGGETGQQKAETCDISAGGVLFTVEQEMSVGSKIEFSIELPAAVLGTETPVEVKCVGRVMRSEAKDGHKTVAAVIDEYKFQRG